MSVRFPASTAPSDSPPERVLAVTLTGPAQSGSADMVCTPLSGLTSDLLAQVRPDRVLTPLFSGGLDATTVIERLEELGYKGPITVIGPTLPRPTLVETELRALGPGARLVLVSRDDPPPPVQLGGRSR